MTTNADFDRIAAAWLAEGPTELADRVLDASLGEVHLTHQRRAAPWRNLGMTFLPSSASARALVAAAVAVIALGGAMYFLSPRQGAGGPSPTAVPSPTAPTSAAPSPSIDPLNTSIWQA